MNNIKISLGRNCNPRVHIKNKFNLSKNNGYKSCVFDLCITSYESLCSILENNFKNFFDDLKIIIMSSGEASVHNHHQSALSSPWPSRSVAGRRSASR